MMEAMRTPAYYIGVMGSKRTSKNRTERLARSGGLSPQQIALSAIADILGTFNGRL
jgi:xanthine dehydrogenase accessory factor